MNENLERLKDFKEWIERGEREHKEILETEGEIGRPLHQASEAAKRKYRQVSEGRAPREDDRTFQEFSDHLKKTYGIEVIHGVLAKGRV